MAFTTLGLTLSNFATLKFLVMKGNGDATLSMIMLYPFLCRGSLYGLGNLYHIQRGCSHCLSLRGGYCEDLKEWDK